MENPGRGGMERDPFSEHSSRYEAWFSDHPNAYQAEVRAVRELMGPAGRSVEIGVGTGRFAVPLGVTWGVDPALPMLRTAREKGVEAVLGVGEALPFPDSAFDLALMVTTVCFLDDHQEAFLEAHRILRPGGRLIVGFVDRSSPLGTLYLHRKEQSVFYRTARFYTVAEIKASLTQVGFGAFEYRQTLFGPLPETLPSEPVKKGHGEGSFVVVGAHVPMH